MIQKIYFGSCLLKLAKSKHTWYVKSKQKRMKITKYIHNNMVACMVSQKLYNFDKMKSINLDSYTN